MSEEQPVRTVVISHCWADFADWCWRRNSSTRNRQYIFVGEDPYYEKNILGLREYKVVWLERACPSLNIINRIKLDESMGKVVKDEDPVV